MPKGKIKHRKTTSAQWERKKSWPKYLVRNSASGTFYARFKVDGKQVWRTLKTDKITNASATVGDEVAKHRAMRQRGDGRITLERALALQLERIENDPTKKPRTVAYYHETAVAISKTWPGRMTVMISKVTADDCRRWGKLHAKYSASVFNRSLGILRKAFDIGIEFGARVDNPLIDPNGKPVVPRRRETAKPLKLPEPKQFKAFIKSIETAGGRDSKNCARLVRFLAYGGFRLGEAASVLWRDVDRARGQITVWGGKGRDDEEWRLVPIIPAMEKLLDEIRQLHPEATKTDPVMAVRECQKAMNRAAKKVMMKRITHHDLRHLFATRAIESGIDIPTVSRWLGHKDGGVLAMRIYGHLRDHHSAEMARRVVF